LENTNQVILRCHLKCGHGLYCDSTVALDSLHYFFDQSLEHCLWNQQTCCIFVKEFFLGVSIRISSVSLVFPNLFQCYSASRSETVRSKPSISAQRVASHGRLRWAKFLLPRGCSSWRKEGCQWCDHMFCQHAPSLLYKWQFWL
jgi:hypothetical protein